MVKMNNTRGAVNSGRGRPKPRPLFPPGELPLFGPPPAYMRRPPGPPIPPPARHGPMGPYGEYGPPPPPPLRPPHLGPPMVPHVPHPMRRRPGPPPPPMPLLQAPVMPPRRLPFMRGRPMPRLGPGNKLPPKNIKKMKNKKNKKPNQTKTEGEYFCEVCDRAWVTQEELDEHTAEHVKCHFEGCVYTAAPKLVTLHIKLQHDSGVFERIVKSYNQDEINKWKEERRRNYPTLENIEKKLAQKKEMEERGERMVEEKAPFKKGKGFSLKKGQRSNDRGRVRERKRKRKSGLDNNHQQFLSTASVTEDMVVENAIAPSANVNFSDDEWIEEEKKCKAEPTPAISNVLLALGTSYASDSEDEIEEDKSKKPKIISPEDNDEQPAELKISRKEDEAPNIHIEIAQKDKHGEKQQAQKPAKPDKTSASKQSKAEWKAPVRKRPLTLLEKLLSKEIKQERNFILQCVRYIIQENYFEDKKT